jgi:hypothetical protein
MPVAVMNQGLPLLELGSLFSASSCLRGMMTLAGGRTTRMQDAIRILMLLDAAAEPLPQASSDPALSSAVGIVRTQVRLQKLDFWVRNPDYLANELLNDFENGDRDPTLLILAEQILDSEEPELRRYPMLRYLFGAYEQLDDALAVLRQADLVVRRLRGTPGHITQHDYYVLAEGRAKVSEIMSKYPPLAWYGARSKLVVALADGQGATQLKDRQYLQEEYLNTPHGLRIPSITDRARARLATLRLDGRVNRAV